MNNIKILVCDVKYIRELKYSWHITNDTDNKTCLVGFPIKHDMLENTQFSSTLLFPAIYLHVVRGFSIYVNLYTVYM